MPNIAYVAITGIGAGTGSDPASANFNYVVLQSDNTVALNSGGSPEGPGSGSANFAYGSNSADIHQFVASAVRALIPNPDLHIEFIN